MENKLFDAMNCSNSTAYTKIPNDLLRNKNISGKAKALLCLLLSNEEGWCSYITTLKTMMKESTEAILSGLKELEQYGYFKKFVYRDKQTKRIKGSFWAYGDTPNTLNIYRNLKYLEEHDLEISNIPQKPEAEKPASGKPVYGESGTNKTNIKRTIYKEKTLSVPTQKNSLKNKNKEYIPLAEKLAIIIQTKKNVNISQTKINQWANDVRLMVETDGIEYVRIRKALKWYATNIGGRYVPVIESGGSLREKFLKLENAIEREKENDSSYISKKPTNSIGTLRNGKKPTMKYRKPDLIIH